MLPPRALPAAPRTAAAYLRPRQASRVRRGSYGHSTLTLIFHG